MPHATGHVKLIERKRGPKFYASMRVNGHYATRLIGPAWLKRGRPPEGHFTHAMAEVELHKLLNGSGAAPGPGNGHTFGAACVEWLRYLEQEKLAAERTLQSRASAVRARLAPFFGNDTPIGEITTGKIDDYRVHALTVGGAHGRPLKPTTVQNDLTFLSGIFGRARRLKWITDSPYDECERVRIDYEGDDIVFLTVEEVYALARGAESEQEVALYLVAALTGLRFGELRSLRWRDVDFVGAAVRVRKNLPVHATREKRPKSRKGSRSLPLLDQAARALDGLSRRGYLARGDDLVFVGKAGGHLDYETTKDAFYAALVRADLGHLRERDKPITFHCLRHTFGTRMAAAGVPMRTLQEWMGHARTATTEIYSHYAPRTDDAARLSAIIAAETVPRTCPEPAHSDDTERNSEQLTPA